MFLAMFLVKLFVVFFFFFRLDERSNDFILKMKENDDKCSNWGGKFSSMVSLTLTAHT